MPLKFGRLGVATKTYYVQKTGFPFYDACQLVGAMHLFFGSGASSLRDHGAYWELSGVDSRGEDTEVPLKREVFLSKARGSSFENIGKIFKVLDSLGQHYTSISEYYKAAFPKKESRSSASRAKIGCYLESSLLTGARGVDAAKYRVLALERGTESKGYLPEVIVAAIGLTQSAIAYGGDEAMTILPVLGDAVKPIVPLSIFRRRFDHKGGGAISGVYASLAILIDLQGIYNVKDFAYAYHRGRTFHNGGLLGLHRLCAVFTGVQQFAQQALGYLERTRSLEAGAPLDLARLLADFLKNPSMDTLAAMARAKARVLVDEDLPVYVRAYVRAAASELLGTMVSIQEAMRMAEARQIPPPSEALVKAVGEVFRGEREGAWIGAYIGLERADKPEKFYAEVAKILSRALARAEKERKWLAKNLKEAMDSLSSEEVLSAHDQRTFPAHKTAFLLRVLASMQYQPAKLKADEPVQGEEA